MKKRLLILFFFAIFSKQNFAQNSDTSMVRFYPRDTSIARFWGIILRDSTLSKTCTLGIGFYSAEKGIEIKKFQDDIINTNLVVMLHHSFFLRMCFDFHEADCRDMKMFRKKSPEFIYGVKTECLFLSESILSIMSDKDIIKILRSEFMAK